MDSTDYANERGESQPFQFTSESMKRGFVKKVYGILMVQLLITFGFIAWFVFDKTTKTFIQEHVEMVYIALAVILISMIVLACCGDVRRRTPVNYIVLFIFTLAESFFLGSMASYFDADEVFTAVGITAFLSLGLTLFAFQTKFDMTMLNGFLFVLLLIMIQFGFLSIFFWSNILSIVYASLGAFVFAIYLLFDTQLMMGGKHRYQISPEEYVFAALNLYLDVINLFIYVLSLIGACNN